VRYWYVYVPRHVAGSGGCRLIGKVQATEREITRAFGHCARISENGVVEVYKRP
jgi:hypothetical protein